jgi:hypothetical protein
MADRVGETQAETGFDDRLMAQADAEREPVGVRLLNGECLLGSTAGPEILPANLT